MLRVASALVLLAGSALAALGCSGESASELRGAPGAPSSEIDDTQPTPDASSGSSSGATSSSSSSSSGSSGTVDAGTDSGTPKAKNAFDGAPAYAAMVGPTTRKAGHNFANATPRTNPAGRACLNCHGDSGGAPTFSAAGTVYAGTTPASSVEVRVLGNDGKAYSTYTDADGNFFFRASTQLIELPAMVGVRNASGARLMTTLVTSGNCNQCHSNAGGAGRIAVGP
ncbi:MAG: hypothetical protein JST00_11100 [Deltaproteobacteria bacterium]|nr:hypothetical protein [Deltaproteobacteria bacterium]